MRVMTVCENLSAPEAHVLLSLPRFDAAQSLKLGFISLIAQGLVRMEKSERRVMLRRLRFVYLYDAADPALSLPPIPASLLGAVRAARPGGALTDVLKAARRAYGKGFGGFVTDHVAPALIERGLAERRAVRLLGLFRTTRLFRTPAGDSEKTRIEGALSDARAIPDFLERDPAQAAALAAALGGAILLLPELQPHLRGLAAAMRPNTTGGDVPFGDGGGFDFGTIDFAAADFDGIDFDGFDSGFSDAGGDGGGDSGGGDSGGGDGGGSGC